MLRELIIIGCVFSACAKPPDYAKHAGDVSKSFALRTEKEEGFTSLGSGGSYSNKKIDSLYIDFEVKRKVSPEEAKILLSEMVNSFVEYVNQNEGIKPFLQTYPITPKQISASIAFIDNNRVPVEGFSQIHLYDGVIYYSAFQPEKKEYYPYQKELYEP